MMKLILLTVLMVFSGMTWAEQSIKIAYLTQVVSMPAALSNLEPFVHDKGLQGALLGLNDNNTTGQFTGDTYHLEQKIVPINGNVEQVFLSLLAEGIELFVINLPAKQLERIHTLNKGKALLLDVATREDYFRSQHCLVDTLHFLPSRAMRADALAHYMLKKRWNKWFIVVGNAPEDALYAEALRRSAKRFGMKIVAEKKWQHNYDARRTAQSDIPVFTQVDDYDVLVVADEQGLFGEYISYRSWLPRPVIGTQGLVATAWHSAHEQWGAVQIQNRFKALAHRPMKEEDYAAYLAVRAIGEAVTRIKKSNARVIKEYLLSARFKLQGYKGKPLTFRTWNGQLRQPVLLAAAKSLVATPPLDGFLHPKNALDTLGFDEPEVNCQSF